MLIHNSKYKKLFPFVFAVTYRLHINITWVTLQKDGPTVVNLKLDGIIPGDYLTQATTKSPVSHPVIDVPADPEVVEKMKNLKVERDAKLAEYHKAKAEKSKKTKSKKAKKAKDKK